MIVLRIMSIYGLWLVALIYGSSVGSDQLLLVATTDHLRYYNVSDPNDRGTSIPVINISNAVAVGYDPTEKRIYWSDVREHTISRAYVTGTADQQVLFSNVTTADGLTLDVYNRMLYWTDTNSDTVEQSTMDGRSRKTLISRNLDQPRAIVLDVDDRMIYWTDWGSPSRIERARLDGTDRKQIVTKELVTPNAMVLDLDFRLMYWADAGLDRIEVAKMDGSSRRILLNENGIHPFALVINGDYLYWSDWSKMAILKQDRFHKSKDKDVISSMPRYTGLKAIMLKSGKSGRVLNIIPDILLAGGDNQIREIYLDIDNDLGKPISSLSGVRLPLSIDFDVNKDEIYWTELQTKSIRKARRGGSDEQALITDKIEYPSGLAVSHETNELFWADRNLALIEKINLLTLSRTTILNNDLISPSDIALDSRYRHVYWTDFGKNTIERAFYDGQGRQKILYDLAAPSAIVLDIAKRLLYWGDFNSAILYKANMDGRERVQLRADVRVEDLALLGKFLYWSELEKNYIGRLNRHTRQEYSVLASETERFMGLGIIKYGKISFTDVSPVIGPVAGGTNITIRGHNFLRVVGVKIGDRLKCVIKQMNSSSIIATTSAVSQTAAGKQYLISIKFTGDVLQSTGYHFTYKPDPTVVLLYPLTTLKRGGTILTVKGNYLDSVAAPVLKLTRLQQSVNINTDIVIKETRTTRFGNCDVVNRTQLACITPSFDEIDTSVNAPGTGVKRLARDTRALSEQVNMFINQVSRIESITRDSHVIVKRELLTREIEIIYTGLRLDGVSKYINLSKNIETKNFSRINFINPPHFSNSRRNEPLVFSSKQKIAIEGEGVDKLAVDNYIVDIGLGRCEGISITSNKLFCLPPQKEPSRSVDNERHKHPIVVHIGRNIAENVGDLDYPFSSDLYLGLGCGAVLLVVLIIIIVIIVARRKSSKKTTRRRAGADQWRHRQEDDNGQIPNVDEIHLPPMKFED
ncbi:hypothetical protein LSH36_278g02066 [Paralvinella palmiformis]|uniref:IPT/TIG domain-containing protein n=1 Tax=Paralvinella palmiformis TaxID=53620 RepID=A0AAD9JJA9_9ANNE|nr:hypothetical protein LSH36_278g02066 [Paralvinella palmiformis]